MTLLGEWIAADAGGSGTTLPNRVDTGDNGTLSGGCTWVTVQTEAAVRCPSADYVEVADRSYWDLTTYTFIARLMFNTIGGAQGILSHSEGSGGGAKKWVWETSYTVGGDGAGIHWSPNHTIQAGTWTQTNGVIYDLAVTHDGGTQDIEFYLGKASTGTATQSNFENAAATLKIGWGGEAFFNSDVSIIALQIYDSVEAAADIFAVMTANAGSGIGSNVVGPMTRGLIAR